MEHIIFIASPISRVNNMFFENSKLLSNEFKYDYSESEFDKFNIIYGITQNFLLGAVISMESVIKHNIDMTLSFHLFIESISNEELEKLEKTEKLYKTTISIYIINNSSLSFLPITERWPYATFYRIIGFEILSSRYDAALYLDADVTCKGSLSQLLDVDLSNYYFAAVPDLAGLQERAEKLNIVHNSKYFNSGVMFANLNKWKENKLLSEFIIKIKNNKDNSLFPDQDILNIISEGNVFYLDKNYNFLYGMDGEIKIKNQSYYKDKLTKNVKLIHYVGVSKPWHEWINYPSAQFFREIYHSSIWSTIPLEKASTVKQLKKKSSHEKLQKKYFNSFLSHINYIIAKIKLKIK